MRVKVSHTVVFDSLQPHGLQPSWLLWPWNPPDKNSGLGCHFLLQGSPSPSAISLTWGSNPGLLHCRQILYQLSRQGSLCERFAMKHSLLHGFDFLGVQFWKQCYTTKATMADTCKMEKLFLGKPHFAAKQSRVRRRQWHPTPVLLPGKSHGWRSLVGCSPWGCQESDTTERLHFHTLEKEMATHSSVFAWRIPGTGEPGGLPSLGSHRVRHD